MDITQSKKGQWQKKTKKLLKQKQQRLKKPKSMFIVFIGSWLKGFIYSLGAILPGFANNNNYIYFKMYANIEITWLKD